MALAFLFVVSAGFLATTIFGRQHLSAMLGYLPNFASTDDTVLSVFVLSALVLGATAFSMCMKPRDGATLHRPILRAHLVVALLSAFALIGTLPVGRPSYLATQRPNTDVHTLSEPRVISTKVWVHLYEVVLEGLRQ